MYCTTHNDVSAAGVCSFSGKPFCQACLIELEGKLYGKPYVDNAIAAIRDEAALRSPATVFMNAGGTAVAAAQPPALIGIMVVPFYRKRWFIVLMICTVFSVIDWLILATGPVYRAAGDGSWLPVRSKWLYALLVLPGLAALIAL